MTSSTTGIDTLISSLSDLQNLLKQEKKDKPWSTGQFKELAVITIDDQALKLLFLRAREREESFQDALDLIFIASRINDDLASFKEALKSAIKKADNRNKTSQLLQFLEKDYSALCPPGSINRLKLQEQEQRKKEARLPNKIRIALNSLIS